MEELEIIDSHTHVGIQSSDNSGILDLYKTLELLKIRGVCTFALPDEIYDRGDKDFENPEIVEQEYIEEWNNQRKEANEYVKDCGTSKELQDEFHIECIPYFFVWNDFSIEQLDDSFHGVKWHRHGNEAMINYDDPKCEKFLQHVYKMKIPIVFEDVFENTLKFVERVGGKTDIIIPHCGMMNGGYYKLEAKGIWNLEYVYTDTSLVASEMVGFHIKKNGADRILWGSDWPSGFPETELKKFLSLKLDPKIQKKVLSENIKKLLSKRRILKKKK